MKHREMPARYGLTRGLQLWVNLPPEVRETEPHCRQISPEEIPEERGPGFVLRRIAGGEGALSLHLPVEWEDVEMEPRSSWECRVPPGGRGFLYFLDGLAYRESEDEEDRFPLKPGMFWPLEGGERLLLRGDRAERSRFAWIRFSPVG
jgi:redox-sensitive bicupin YhaK (pirin superfamily)